MLNQFVSDLVNALEKEFGEEYRKRIKTSIDFLNQIDLDWADAINLDQLKIKDPCHCICGQLFNENRSQERVQNLYDFFDAEFYKNLFASGYDHFIEAHDNGNGILSDQKLAFTIPTLNEAKWAFLQLLWIEAIEKKRAIA